MTAEIRNLLAITNVLMEIVSYIPDIEKIIFKIEKDIKENLEQFSDINYNYDREDAINVIKYNISNKSIFL
jgi:hypothetical protein